MCTTCVVSNYNTSFCKSFKQNNHPSINPFIILALYQIVLQGRNHHTVSSRNNLSNLHKAMYQVRFGKDKTTEKIKHRKPSLQSKEVHFKKYQQC